MEIKTTDIILIAGKRGSGKTTLSKAQINFLLNNKCPVRTIDPLMEYREYQSKTIWTHLPYGDRQAMDNYLRPLFNSWRGMVVIDEANGYFPNRKDLYPYQNKFIHIGRHYGLGGMFITRRLANLHTDIVSQANKIFIFRLFSPADLDYINEAGLGHLVPHIINLRPYEFLSIDTDAGEIAVNEPI